jgi:hypothetical protein
VTDYIRKAKAPNRISSGDGGIRKPGALPALSPPALSRRHAGVRHRLPPGPFDIPDPL